MRAYFEEKYFKLGSGNIVLFLFIWLMTGFALGTATLLGPVRWLSTLARSEGWSQSAEDLLVKAVIICFVIFSAWLSLKLTRFTLRSNGKLKKAGYPSIAAGAAVVSVLLWLNPQAINTDQAEESISVETDVKFVFGPYPTAEKIKELSERGFTAVVPLLHPAVVPFEPKLLQEEKELAASADMEVIHIPMLPWVSDNESALEELKKLCGREGKFYIHCYLGKDRVNVARRILEETCGNTDLMDVSQVDVRESLVAGRSMEKGEIIKVMDEVFITPCPTKEELFNWFADGVKFVAIVSDDPKSKWVLEEARELEKFGMNYRILSGDPESQAELKSYMSDRQKHPMVVHGYLVSDEIVRRLAEDMNVMRSRIDPSAADLVVQGEKVRQISPYIFAGKLPLSTELDILFKKGVRNIAVPKDFALSAEEKSQIKEIGFRVMHARNESIGTSIRGGGTWYIVDPAGTIGSEEAAETFTQDKTLNG